MKKLKKHTHNKMLFKDNFRYYFLIILIFSLLGLFYFEKDKKIKENIKICLCVLGKKENKYVREFIHHYKNYGIDKIIIYDNNDINGEKFETVISDYLKSKFVEIRNFRGQVKIQIRAVQDCYKTNYQKYDWFMMFDMDEFIYLENFKNAKIFLKDKRFSNCNLIHLNRRFYTDNNQIYYKKKLLSKRFTQYTTNFTNVKPILRGKLENIIIKNHHIINSKYKACNGFGLIKNDSFTDFNYYYLNHYYFKSTEEFIDKLNRGDSFYTNNDLVKIRKINYYFSFNKITKEKIDFIEKKTLINLQSFRKKILSK